MSDTRSYKAEAAEMMQRIKEAREGPPLEKRADGGVGVLGPDWVERATERLLTRMRENPEEYDRMSREARDHLKAGGLDAL